MMKRGFTLLEVLVAASVLFIVSSAVVGLSNTIIQGTVSNSDKTVMNRFSSEGLELVQKLRDEKILQHKTDTDGNPLWLDQATSVDRYGWYKLEQEPISKAWKLTATAYQTKQPISAIEADFSEVVTADQTTAYRLICFESIGAKQFPDDDKNVYCNAKNENGDRYDDGDRAARTTCHTDDVYCAFSQTSLNKSNITSTSEIIPAGNAVKVRSVVTWADKSMYKVSDIGTILTNWQL